MLLKSLFSLLSVISFALATPPACFLSCVQVIARWCEHDHGDFRCICDNSPSLVGCLVDICPYGNFFSARDHFWGTCLERLSENTPTETENGESFGVNGPKQDGLFEDFPEEWEAYDDDDEDEDDEYDDDEDEDEDEDEDDDQDVDEDEDEDEDYYEEVEDDDQFDEGTDDEDGKLDDESEEIGGDLDSKPDGDEKGIEKDEYNTDFYKPDESVSDETVASQNSKLRDRPSYGSRN